MSRILPRVLLMIALVLAAPVLAAPPSVTSFFPSGASRGQSVEVTAAGSFERWPVQAWVSEPGLTITCAAEKGKLRVQVAEDATPGVRWVRFYDEQGASALKPFRVGTLPESLEVEPNDAPGKAQEIASLPVIVHGRLAKRGDVDGFAVSLRAGQTLVADLEGQRLGSPMDAVLQLATPEGFVLAQAEDGVGLDPLLVFTVPRDGTYVVRTFAFPLTPDSSIAFAGADTFLYRLTITAGPYLDHVRPMAIRRGVTEEATVEAVGWNLTEGLRHLPARPVAASDSRRVWHSELGQTIELPVVDHPSLVEDEAADSQAVTLPAAITGRIEPARDRDVYRFTSREGQVWKFAVTARALGSALDAILRVREDSGKVLAEQDDSGNQRDPVLTFTTPQDGEYRLEIGDVTEQGGPRHFYRLDADASRPDFSLAVADDRVTLNPGKPVEIKVAVARVAGCDAAITVSLSGLPEGVTAEPVVSEPKGPTAKEVKLSLKGPDQPQPFQGPIAIVGRAKLGDDEQQHQALTTIAGFTTTTGNVWLTVGKP